jgi:hypothetical protein
MISFITYLKEEKVRSFTNWISPSDEDIALEYKIEYEIKPLKKMTNDAFPTLADFKTAVKNAKAVKLTPSLDSKVQYRSRTSSKEQIINLIKGYASYPQFRNEKTIESIFQGFRDNKPMKMPFVLKMPNGSLRIMSGNTRIDIAIMLGLVPKVLVIEVPQK